MKPSSLWLALPLLSVAACTSTFDATDAGLDTTTACACDANMARDTGGLVDTGAALDAARSDDAGSDTGGSDTPATCNDVSAILTAAAANVLFLSESDRAIEVHFYAGEGLAAPTEASVVAKAALAASATHTTRPTANFARAFEPNVGAPDTAPATLSAAIDANLRDLIYVAIIDPAAPAEVHVILAGRTACGDLVFLQSVSIET